MITTTFALLLAVQVNGGVLLERKYLGVNAWEACQKEARNWNKFEKLKYESTKEWACVEVETDVLYNSIGK